MCILCVGSDGNQVDDKSIIIRSCLFYNAFGVLRNLFIPDCANCEVQLFKDMESRRFICLCSEKLKFKVKMGDAIKIKLTAGPPEKFSFEDDITITRELFQGFGDIDNFLLPHGCKGIIDFTHFMQHLPKGGGPGESITHNDRIVIGRTVVGMTSTSPDDSTKKSSQMQEQQFCSDVAESSPSGAVKRWNIVILTAAMSFVLLLLLNHMMMHEDTIQNDADPNDYTIGKEGGKVSHLGCSIIFPPKAVSKDTRLTLKVERATNIPGKLLPITPMITCEPDHKKFGRNVTVKLQTWAIAINDHVMVKILRRDHRAGDWEEFKEITLSTDIITFEIDHFCSFATVVDSLKAIPEYTWKPIQNAVGGSLRERGLIDVRINNHVHHDENGRILVTFSVDSELMNEEIKTMEKNNGYNSSLSLPIKLKVNAQDVIEYRFRRINPEGVSFMTESDTKMSLEATIPVLRIAEHQRYVQELLLGVHDDGYVGKVKIAYIVIKRRDDTESRFIILRWPLDREQSKSTVKIHNAPPEPANDIEEDLTQVDEPARDEL